MSVPWGGTTPWGGSKHPQPPLTRRLMIRAMRLLFAPPDPTRRVQHGSPITLAGRDWLALHTPGHTLDHLCLYDPENGVLLSGDHVLPVDHAARRRRRARATRSTRTSRRSTSSARSTA